MEQASSVFQFGWNSRCLSLVALAAWLFLVTPKAFCAPDSMPCSENFLSRPFDFWLGEWNVSYPGARNGGVSKISLSLDKCLVVESWEGQNMHQGENIFAYSIDDKSWHALFTDNRGRVHVFEGKVAPGSAELYGPSRGPNGEVVLNRVKVVRLDANNVEQTWEKSIDQGKTWAMEYRGQYSRKNP